VRDALATRDAEVAAPAMRGHIETIIGYWSPELLKRVRSGQGAP
jgi:DNA-binding GntR family transcriptional regulator